MILLAYLATIVGANVLFAYAGLVPVGFGLYAPAGVYAAGLAFSLRDWLQERDGRAVTVLAILVGAALSAGISGRLALASGTAFLLSELADFAVYTPLRRRGWAVAVIASNVVGLMIDSAIFLFLAFGSLAFLPGQIVGKFWTTAVVVGCVAAWRAHRAAVLAR